MTRRDVLGWAAKAGLGLVAASTTAVSEQDPHRLPDPAPGKLPRWRGFNLMEMFQVHQAQPFREQDFAEIAGLGFDFVRLPLDYRCWTDPGDWTEFREDRLRWIDEAIGFGRKSNLHVQLNFHRAPGYSVASPPEPKSLWTDDEALDICARHWGRFARRYRGIPSREVSFNPLNEPARVGPEPHKRVIARLVQAIREHDRDRLVVCDGRDWGLTPPSELIGLGVAAATRGYEPFHLTHYRASWVEGSDRWREPTYPLREGETTWDRTSLRKDRVEPWAAIERRGVGVMVGEFGAFNHTPHDVVLRWMRDCLENWKAVGWGWALWNYRGGFGILDSGRNDVAYENWRGHKLDRAMLELLQSA
jgi:endoglucanase